MKLGWHACHCEAPASHAAMCRIMICLKFVTAAFEKESPAQGRTGTPASWWQPEGRKNSWQDSFGQRSARSENWRLITAKRSASVWMCQIENMAKSGLLKRVCLWVVSLIGNYLLFVFVCVTFLCEGCSLGGCLVCYILGQGLVVHWGIICCLFCMRYIFMWRLFLRRWFGPLHFYKYQFLLQFTLLGSN